MKLAKPAFLLIRVGVLMAVVALLVAVAGKAMAQLRVDITHQAADELHLPPARFPSGDAPRLGDGVLEALGKRQARKPLGA